MTLTSPVPVKKTNGKLQPYGLFDQLEDEMQRLFRWPFIWPASFWQPFQTLAPSSTVNAPRTDIYEKDGTLVIKSELPGLKKEDVHVEIVGTDLVISGETKTDTEVKDTHYYRTERSFGSFYRRLPLPAGTAMEQITASLAEGVLELVIPKQAEPKLEATKIEVK
jgi:HSP20 family protein